MNSLLLRSVRNALTSLVVMVMIALPALRANAAIRHSVRQAAVSIISTGFDPQTVTISTGDSVRWTNNDTREHSLSGQSAGLKSGVLGVGSSFEFTFVQTGTFRIFDLFSEVSSMTVIVQGTALAHKVHLPLTSRG
jgi:plastocyanin